MPVAPYKNTAFNKLYNLLFCDDASLFRASGNAIMDYPWNILVAEKPAVDDLIKVRDDTGLESRCKIIACRLLTANKQPVASGELLGVVIEVGMENGLDTLAAYKDGTARYINQAEKMIVWDAPTASSQALIDKLFAVSEKVVRQIGPWDKKRLPPPANGDIRLSFLVTDGLYFGEGPFTVLSADAMGGPVISAATALLLFLTEQK